MKYSLMLTLTVFWLATLVIAQPTTEDLLTEEAFVKISVLEASNRLYHDGRDGGTFELGHSNVIKSLIHDRQLLTLGIYETDHSGEIVRAYRYSLQYGDFPYEKVDTPSMSEADNYTAICGKPAPGSYFVIYRVPGDCDLEKYGLEIFHGKIDTGDLYETCFPNLITSPHIASHFHILSAPSISP